MYGVLYCLLSGLDGTRHSLCGSVSQGMMNDPAAMQAFSAAAAGQSMVGSQHRGQMPSQYAGSNAVTLPAHHAPVRHSHPVVDNVYANVPGTFAVFLS